MPLKKQREKDVTGKQVADNVTADPRSPTTTSYQSPLKKLKSTIDKHQRKVIDSVDGKCLSGRRACQRAIDTNEPSICCRTDLREFITHSDGKDKEVCASVRIKARLLWIAPDTVASLHFLRLYFGECQVPEPLVEQQQAFKQAQREDLFETNQFLITVSLLKVDIDDPKLPHPGDVVMITPYKLNVYRNCCQVDAKLYGLTNIDIP